MPDNQPEDGGDGDSWRDERETCGYPTATGDPCGNPAMNEDGSCWLDTHGEDPAESEGDGRGPDPEDMEGNDNAEGNPGGAAPEGNFNAAETGLHMGVKRRIEWFKEKGDPWLGLFEDYFVEYAGKAENRTDAAAIAAAAVVRDMIERELIVDGPTYEKVINDDTGETARMPKTSLIEGWNDTRREIRLGQDYEGINNNDSGGESAAQRYGGDASALWSDSEDGGDEPASPSVN